MDVIGSDGTVAENPPSLVMEAGDTEDKSEKSNDQDTLSNVNLMDFSDTTLGFSHCAKMQFSRPVLNTVREQSYESKAHTSQAMQEMYRLLKFWTIWTNYYFESNTQGYRILVLYHWIIYLYN